jgi:uncharacterized protein (DUF488 family)
MAEIVAYTIGHSTHEAGTFAALLRRHGIDVLADVRRYPGSRRVTWTNPGEIERALELDYVHLPSLGGRRRPRPDSPNGGWRSDQFRGYADHMASGEFESALERLIAIAAERRVAAMCAEAQWWRCHRRLLADALTVKGVAVEHLDARGATERHALTPFAVVEGSRIAYPPAQASLEV